MSEFISGSDSLSLNRRQFLGSSMALGVASSVPLMSGCSTSQLPAEHYQTLRASDLVLLKALTPTITGITAAALTNSMWQAFSRQLDRSLTGFGALVVAEYRTLFDLLDWSLSRGVLSGHWSSWEEAEHQDIESFLYRWRTSSITELNKGYRALTGWLASSWYALPGPARQTGYPGVPSAILPVLQTR